MIRLKAFCLLIGCAIVFCSCASSYRQIYPRTLDYTPSAASNADLQLGYRYNVLAEKGNKKLHAAARNKNIQLVAIEVTNNTDRSLVFGRDIQLESRQATLPALPNGLVYTQLRQKPPIYLLYLLLSPLRFTYYRNDGHQVRDYTLPAGLVLGPGLTIANMSRASASNRYLLSELTKYDLTGKTIEPGQKAYGLVALGITGKVPLYLRLIEQPSAAAPFYE